MTDPLDPRVIAAHAAYGYGQSLQDAENYGMVITPSNFVAMLESAVPWLAEAIRAVEARSEATPPSVDERTPKERAEGLALAAEIMKWGEAQRNAAPKSIHGIDRAELGRMADSRIEASKSGWKERGEWRVRDLGGPQTGRGTGPDRRKPTQAEKPAGEDEVERLACVAWSALHGMGRTATRDAEIWHDQPTISCLRWIAAVRAVLLAHGHGEPCLFCSAPIDNHSPQPALHASRTLDAGVLAWVHAGCVGERTRGSLSRAEADRLRAVALAAITENADFSAAANVRAEAAEAEVTRLKGVLAEMVAAFTARADRCAQVEAERDTLKLQLAARPVPMDVTAEQLGRALLDQNIVGFDVTLEEATRSATAILSRLGPVTLPADPDTALGRNVRVLFAEAQFLVIGNHPGPVTIKIGASIASGPTIDAAVAELTERIKP